MDLGLPVGVRDFGPGAAARLLEATGCLTEVFAAHGYQRVVVPTIERASVVRRGLGEHAAARLFQAVEPGTGEVVAVCPDHTAQVARMWAASLQSLPPPVRVFYVAPVMRALEERAGRPREAFQAGVECLGAGGPGPGAEVAALCARALDAAGLREVTLDLGHAGFVRAVIDAAGLPAEAREETYQLLGRKDAASLERLLGGLGRAAAPARRARSALASLTTLYGQGTLDRARRLGKQSGVGEGAIAEVEAVLAALEPLGLPARLTLDLGEARGHGYYTGLTLHAFAAGAGAEIAGGGRYDDLLGHYGRHAPAVGVAMDLGFLLEALGNAEVASEGAVLVAAGRAVPELLAAGERLRRAGHRVALLFGARRLEEGLEHARRHGLSRVLVPTRDPARFKLIAAADGAASELVV